MLRNYASGRVEDPDKVRSAIQCLAGHHSRSELPLRARQQFHSQTAGAMASSTHSGPWTCRCDRLNKAKVDHRAKCGAGWWQQFMGGRACQLEQLAARRPMAVDAKQATRIAAWGQARPQAIAQPPSMQALPPPPKPHSLPSPRLSLGSDGSAMTSTDRKLLEAILPHVKDADALPASIRDSLKELSVQS